MKKNQTKLLFVILSISLLILTSCGGMPFTQSSSKNINRDYYTGTQGVIMRFSDPMSPPARMYYYEDASREENSFQIMVDVHNIGSSWTKGALFVSGYDPYMIKIENINIESSGLDWSNCFFDVRSFLGGASVHADCPKGSFTLGDQGIEASTRDLGKLLGFDDSILNDIGINIGASNSGYTLGFSIPETMDADLFNHGKGLLIAMSSLSFTTYNGFNYDGDTSGQGLLEPDTPDFPGGEMNTIMFEGHVDNWPRGLDQTDKPISFLVTNCFIYSTIATPQVCIDPAPYDQGVKVCQPRKISFNGGNGAPVAITTIVQENARRKIYFDMTIKNVGSGTVFNLGSMELCSPYYPGRLTTLNLNRVHVLDARIGNQHLDCVPDRGDGIRLTNGVGHLRCSYDMQYTTAKSAYETPLVVELGYGYSTTMMKKTTIKRVM